MKSTPLILLLAILSACTEQVPIPDYTSNVPFMELHEKFDIYNGIMTNGWTGEIMVAMDGSVLADRRSIDGGKTWGPYVPNLGGQGRVLNENNGHILKLDPGGNGDIPENFMYRSFNNGISFEKENITRHPDINGWHPIISGCEEGITLRHGKHKGRLLMPARVLINYNSVNDSLLPYHYSSAIYSDDNGKTWYCSKPYPISGTGESALVELSDGTIYYNSRNHNRPGNRDIAWSYDGGETWTNQYICTYLPDGPPNFYGNKCGLVRLEIDEADILIFSMTDNPNGPTAIHSTAGRINITVWASFDGGRTWPVKRLVSTMGGYSHLASGRQGTPSEGLIFLTTNGLYARFNLAWITQGKDWHEFLK